jgi:hypothetical protein
MRRAGLVLAILTLAMSAMAAEDGKGKAVIVVQDISPSIAPYFPTIQNVLARVLIDRRLEVKDYFALISFSGNPSISDGAQIQYPRDVEARKAIWSRIRPEGKGTDIGLAIKTALDTTVELRNQGYANFDPLVLFVTDGEHEPPTSSRYFGKTIDQIFSDPYIGDTTLYQGWYFVGIGKDLKDIKRIAELSGRSDAFLSIDDPSRLEAALDEFLSRIPPPRAREKAEVRPAVYIIEGSELETDGRAVVKRAPSPSMAIRLASSYRETDSVVELTDLKMTFQSSDQAVFADLAPAFEKGRIEVARLGSVLSTATLHPSDISALRGNGTIKVELKLRDNYIDRSYNGSYRVSFLDGFEFFWIRWGLWIVTAAGLTLLVAAFLLLRGFLPVAVGMEVLGSTVKHRPVRLSVGDKVEIGAKPNARFHLEGNFEPVVLSLRRTGKSSWEISPRAASQVKTAEGLKPYKLGSILKIEDADGNERSIRFSAKSR